MVSPQCEDGYLQIAMELVEKLTSVRIAGQEWQIIWTVWRKTWGWKKKTDRISLSQFAQATGIDRRKCHILIQNLTDRNILDKSVTYNGDKRIINYGFNKDFEKWKLSPKKVTPFTNIDDIKENIRKRDSNICKLCGYDGNLTKEKLPVHHIDFDEGNNDDNNLITLCKSCHGRSHTHKNKWKEKLLSLVTQKGDGVTPKKVTKLSPKMVLTKDIKDTITKESKTQFRKNVLLTEKEHQTLIEKHGEDKTKWILDKLELAKETHGYKYKSDYGAINSWVLKAWDKKGGQDQQKQGSQHGPLFGSEEWKERYPDG